MQVFCLALPKYNEIYLCQSRVHQRMIELLDKDIANQERDGRHANRNHGRNARPRAQRASSNRQRRHGSARAGPGDAAACGRSAPQAAPHAQDGSPAHGAAGRRNGSGHVRLQHGNSAQRHHLHRRHPARAAGAQSRHRFYLHHRRGHAGCARQLAKLSRGSPACAALRWSAGEGRPPAPRA